VKCYIKYKELIKLYGLYLCGLDDPAFHILLSRMSRPVPAPTQPFIYVIGTGGFSLERSKAAGIKSRTIPLLPLYAFMGCPETTVYLCI
jgi:hypothetical protein